MQQRGSRFGRGDIAAVVLDAARHQVARLDRLRQCGGGFYVASGTQLAVLSLVAVQHIKDLHIQRTRQQRVHFVAVVGVVQADRQVMDQAYARSGPHLRLQGLDVFYRLLMFGQVEFQLLAQRPQLVALRLEGCMLGRVEMA